jgi:Contractile injection system spike tip protein
VGDFIIKTNDMIKITVPPPTIVPMLQAPVPLLGTSTNVTVGTAPICLQGDELPPALRAPMPYTAPPFVTPGVGTLTIILAPDNLSKKTVNGKPIILKGATFQVSFAVSAPAMQPTPAGPVPDPVLTKPGTATFITTNMTVQAT